MATTENTYTGDGSTTSYSLTFQYIDESDIKVSLDGVTTTAYSLSNATTVLFDTAPASDVLIRIYRETDVDSLKTTFFAGSSIRAQDLNDNFLQNNYRTQELTNNTWDKETATIHSDETWVSNDTQIATTAAIDARFFEDEDETIKSDETWTSNDTLIATTQAIDNRVDSKIDTAITSDIATDDTGITITDDGDGTITLGLSNIDLDRIKAEDIITQSEQNADFDLAGDDDSVFTSSAAIRRFENYVQNTAPSGTGIGTGRVWVDVDDDLTLSVWNGSAWVGITSGGTFTNQPKVVYVDASSGDDDNDGHRISRPKATIKAAVNQINADTTHGDGSVVIVAAGVYQEAAPIQIQKKNVSIIGQALRSCIVHPTSATETATLFELNSGSYVANLTLTGMKAGTGTGNTVDADLPTDQGWNFAFFSGATITKSPYIQNCTNFSDSEIDNDDLNANTPAGGAAGDTDSAPTGGGLLVNGDTVDDASPLRSMVCDSYTHVGLNGPGILVTNNGYVQATSSYAFFNKYHIKCLNGGQANLAASTTDFGDQALVADGRSSSAIFTSNVDGAASDGDTTFNINEPTAGTGWFGNTERPATNMLVEVNSVTYPILSATANTDSEGGSGWTVEISRPNPDNRSENLGLNGAITDDAAVSFFLRSMIASSGHTMEYVGSGTNYSALPENGGVPDETKQITESNNGKVWTAITDHNGKFKIGGNQTDDPIFEVDQQLGFVTIPEGSVAFNLLSDETPQLGGDLDVNGNTITGLPTTPTATSEATSRAYVDAQVAAVNTDLVNDTTPQLGGNLDVNGNEITSNSNGDIVINPNGTGDIELGAPVGIGVNDPGSADLAIVHARNASEYARFSIGQDTDGSGVDHLGIWYGNNNTAQADIFTSDGDLNFWVDGSLGVASTSTFSWGERFTTDWMELATQALRIPTGTTADRPTGTAGQIRYNTTNSQFEGFGTAWGGFGGASGAGGDAVFYENDQTVTTSYSITENRNAMSAGPITIDASATVTIPSGSTWVIV